MKKKGHSAGDWNVLRFYTMPQRCRQTAQPYPGGLARPCLHRDRGGPCIRRPPGRSCTATIGWRSRALFVATIVDATDGMLARRARVKEVLPDVDGARIDDIVDYMTFVFVPMLLLEAAGGLYLVGGVSGDRDRAVEQHVWVRRAGREVVRPFLHRVPVGTGTSSCLYLLLFQRPAGLNAIVLLVLERAGLRPDRLRLSVADADAAHADAGARLGLGACSSARSSGCGRRRRAGWRSRRWCFPSITPCSLSCSTPAAAAWAPKPEREGGP